MTTGRINQVSLLPQADGRLRVLRLSPTAQLPSCSTKRQSTSGLRTESPMTQSSLATASLSTEIPHAPLPAPHTSCGRCGTSQCTCGTDFGNTNACQGLATPTLHSSLCDSHEVLSSLPRDLLFNKIMHETCRLIESKLE